MLDTSAEAELSAENQGALVGLTVGLVASYVSRNALPSADLPALIATMHGALQALGAPEPTAKPEKPTPPVSVKKSVADDYLVSMEDGKRYKSLKRHLTKHGLTPTDYRTKWGLPGNYPMVAPAYVRARSKLAKTMGFGLQRRKP